MADAWAAVRGTPVPVVERCGEPRLRDGAPCRNERETCRWHGQGAGARRARARGTGPGRQPATFARQGQPEKAEQRTAPIGTWGAVHPEEVEAAWGRSRYLYKSTRLRHLNGNRKRYAEREYEPPDGPPDGDDGQPLPRAA